MDIKIDPLICTGCGTCTYLCPVGGRLYLLRQLRGNMFV
jgi:ferredoxin